jgi:hypothetical protein
VTEGVSSPTARSMVIVRTSSTDEDSASLSWASASKWNLKKKKKRAHKVNEKREKVRDRSPKANVSDFAASEESWGETLLSVSRMMLSLEVWERYTSCVLGT